ncbi:M23 family metallopeptidase [Lewinella sp. IMCC34183]|uniref:M23 family metallopeptidase n=1 Tax=Lewinella sp. IMCC34183 TaxID=2248762 RepID=UPI000E2680C8|nr:M23 family metallopeptidase [Lewinella sp. IMCC34183]
MIRYLLPLLILLSVASCKRTFRGVVDRVEDIVVPRTPRETFARNRFEGRAAEDLCASWEAAYRSALDDSLSVSLPYREVVRYAPDASLTALSYRLLLPPGRRLTVQVDGGPAPVFGELFTVPDTGRIDPDDAILRWDMRETGLYYETELPQGEELLLLLQSGPADGGTYTVELRTDPILTFPVAGHDQGDVQSFWGDARSGGRRHEGNDIFAPRGTPLVAVADGRVSSVRDGGLGGKTIWLLDAEGRNLSYYYAHLDRQLVRDGQNVSRGDTIGLVGNTGNARTTPAHLHFGIYRNGARDPWPYLLRPDAAPAPAVYPITSAAVPDAVPARGRHYLRVRPESRREVVIRQLENTEPVTVLGATGRFYRIRTGRGETGYVNFD